MTVDDYIRMNRGINNDADLPPDYLTNIYNEIKVGEKIKNVRVNVEKFSLITNCPL